MIKKTFKSALYVLPVMGVIILFATQLWYPSYLITPPQLSGFSYQIEISVSVLLIVFYSLVLPNRFEIELAIVNGYSNAKLAFIKALPIFVYSIITITLAVTIFQYTPFNVTDFNSVIPVFVPDYFKLYVWFSLFVSVLFFSALYFFFRVLLRNCYLPIVSGMFFHMSFLSMSQMVRMGHADVRLCIIDPFISTYIVGNIIPNKYATENVEYAILKNAWTVNRLIFIFLSLILLTITYMLLRREKLHRGME